MAAISREEWNKYIVMLRKVNEKAAMEIVTFMRNNLLHDPTSNAVETLTDIQRKEPD